MYNFHCSDDCDGFLDCQINGVKVGVFSFWKKYHLKNTIDKRCYLIYLGIFLNIEVTFFVKPSPPPTREIYLHPRFFYNCTLPEENDIFGQSVSYLWNEFLIFNYDFLILLVSCISWVISDFIINLINFHFPIYYLPPLVIKSPPSAVEKVLFVIKLVDLCMVIFPSICFHCT